MNKPKIVISYSYNAFTMVDNPLDIEIFVDRKDIKNVLYVIFRGERIDGSFIEEIRGPISSRVRYI